MGTFADRKDKRHQPSNGMFPLVISSATNRTMTGRCRSNTPAMAAMYAERNRRIVPASSNA